MKNNDSPAGESISLKPDQVRRDHFLEMVLEGYITLHEAAVKMGISYRQAKRLKQAYAQQGVSGILHGNLGKKSKRAVSDDIKTKIIHLARTRYSFLSDTGFVDKIRGELGISISRETVRKMLRAEGIKKAQANTVSGRKRRYESSGQEGMMVLWGGMTGMWLPAQQKKCCFMAAVDVATLKCLAARFFPRESTQGYLWLLRKILVSWGIPGAFCQHSQNAVRRRESTWTIEEELRGERDPSQVSRALRRLGIAQYLESRLRITSITALFEDFLLGEIGREQAVTMQRANRILETRLINRFNRRFALGGGPAHKAWRQLPRSIDPARVCSFFYETTVQYNNKVVLGDIEIDIPPNQKRISYAKAAVEVRQLLDGSWRVYYQDDLIATHEATPVHEPVIAKGMKGHNIGLSSAFWVYELYSQGELE